MKEVREEHVPPRRPPQGLLQAPRPAGGQLRLRAAPRGLARAGAGVGTWRSPSSGGASDGSPRELKGLPRGADGCSQGRKAEFPGRTARPGVRGSRPANACSAPESGQPAPRNGRSAPRSQASAPRGERAAYWMIWARPESMIRRSWVRRVAPSTLAVATMMRSAGSRWKLSGSSATAAATAGEMGMR